MGKANEIEKRDSTNTVLSYHMNDAIISDLWRLDSLGICDPSEKKTGEELEQSAEEHFFRTVTRNQHRRVVFGITSSPFLLEATLECHLNNASPDYKETAQKLLKSFYVDNCVHSVDNKEELMKFIDESQEILSPAKFNLRGWEHTPLRKMNLT
ncbi:hypothetical protein AVEN_274517-1 [Araneus ventricosus]|uniref:Uncharacterized protein n=1 Tax=Araneus ventricosus TaxID=182803 RepID=A0A4Y2L160_ARAVE|nr:hypothetical protein AVEN_274517-1 [Araneus ventricosus]